MFVTPATAAARGEEIVHDHLASVGLGAGQFCTKPGLLVVPEDSGMADIVAAEADTAPVTLLHDGIGDAYLGGMRALATHPGVRTLTGAPEGDGRTVRPVLARTTLAELAEFRDKLLAECFGPLSLVVTYRDADEPVLLSPAVAELTNLQALEAFEAAGLACAAGHALRTLLDGSHDGAGPLLVDVDVAGQPAAQMLAHPVHMSRCRVQIRRGVPVLGQDTEDVLAELGFVPGEIRALAGVGAIRPDADREIRSAANYV